MSLGQAFRVVQARVLQARVLLVFSVRAAVTSKTASAAGGVAGLGKGKKTKGKLGAVEKITIPVETDPERLVSYVCGSNIYTTGEDVKLKLDSEYPDWLWSLRLGPAPRLEELDPNTKQYWQKVRTIAMRRNNQLKKLRPF